MDIGLHILIVAKPGHFRESLVAVLKTLPRVELFLIPDMNSQEWEVISQAQPVIALIDLNAIDGAGLIALKKRWPAVRSIALVDHIHSRGVGMGGFDTIMSRGASTGELLSAILRLSSANSISSRLIQAFPAPAIT